MIKAQDPFARVRAEAGALVAQMTLEEKARLCSGLDFWHTGGAERLGLSPVMVTDGPHGLRKQAGSADHLGLSQSVPATCFPPACASACSFDDTLLEEVGRAMGEECRQEGVAVLLGPAANIKRSPLCGRNFEYFSEDPLLSGRSAAALIRGIQSQNVGACLKHCAANNQETARLASDSIIDERALREIYLAGFELAVKEAQPWTLMCAYNKINGVYASDNKRLMDEILRGEWGFGGAVMTDWGAMNDRVAAIRAGLDLEMPGPCEDSAKRILAAIEAGELDEVELDRCAARVAALLLKAKESTARDYDVEAHNQLARRAARESAVLLKLGTALPAGPNAKVTVVGAFAKTPRYQGSGSSKINPHSVTSLCGALDARGTSYTWSAGYKVEGEEPDLKLIAQAVEAARGADVVFACVGLPDRCESEGFDRTHLRLPDCQNALMDALIETGVPVVAVVSTGGVVELPWRDRADSILLLYLTGQNGGNAAADLLFGDANPSGKLAESWPVSLSDVPCNANFGGKGNVEYRESVYVGYRYYDAAGTAVAYPFGHGLSYTSFAYSGLELPAQWDGRGELALSCTVTNTGNRAGAEVAQLYVAPPEGTAFKPVRELRDYAKLTLQPGESRQVGFTLEPRAFARYDAGASVWTVDGGAYCVEIDSSSRDIRLRGQVAVEGAKRDAGAGFQEAAPACYAPDTIPSVTREQFEALLGQKIIPWRPVRPFTRNSTLGELRTCALGREIVQQAEAGMREMLAGQDDLSAMLQAMLEDMPLRQFAMMAGPAFAGERLEELLAQLNAQPEDAAAI